MKRIFTLASLMVVVVPLASCASTGSAGAARDQRRMPGDAEAVSLLGASLERPAIAPDREAVFLANLARAEQRYNADPNDEDAIIWYGRRLAYLGRYREAIDVYSRGLDVHPDSHRLLRHRGHRFITVRRFDDAVADLSRAAQLVEERDIPDQVEADGIPNKENRPRSTTNANIYYHLGLAHYLNGDFDKARSAYLEGLEYSRYSDDMLVATTYWLYNTYRRLRRPAVASSLLATVLDEKMEIIENHTYHDLLRMYDGRIAPGDLAARLGEGDAIENATLAYGLANWHWANGDREWAIDLLEEIITYDNWAAFGYIAAEADLARIRAQRATERRSPSPRDPDVETRRRARDTGGGI